MRFLSTSFLVWSLALAVPASGLAQTVRTHDRVLVVPFENVNREGRLYWLTEASAVLVAQELADGGFDAITRDERLKAFEQLQVPPVAALSEATVIRVGQLVGAAQVVIGVFTADDGRLSVKARSIQLDTGRSSAEVVEEGRLEDLFAVYQRVAKRLLPSRPGLTPRSEPGPHPPLGVFENYVKGLLAESSAAQIRFLEAALKLAPGYDEARLALWQVYTAEGDHGRAAAALIGVPRSSPLSRRARFLVAVSRLRLKQYEEAFEAFKALEAEHSSPALLNNLGVVQSRRGATAQSGRATYFFTKAAEADREDGDYAFNVGYAYYLERDAKAAVYWLKEAVRLNPADGEAHFVLGAALQAESSVVEAGRERELARQLSSTFDEWEKRAATTGETVPHGLERVRELPDTPRLSLVDATLAPGERKDQEELARFHLERGRRLFEQQQDREAIGELKRSVYLLPYQAEAHLLLGRIHLRAGRIADAIAALKISVWSQDGVAAHVALAEAYLDAKQPTLARQEIDKALVLDPRSREARALRDKLGR